MIGTCSFRCVFDLPQHRLTKNVYKLKSFEHGHPIPKDIKKYGSNLYYHVDVSKEDIEQAQHLKYEI